MESGQDGNVERSKEASMPQDEQDLVERVSAMLLGELAQGGKRDLAAMRLDDLESEVFGLADRVSRRVAESLLQEQADTLSRKKMLCPCCQGELVPKPPQSRRLQLRRGEAQWDEPAWRCLSCRRDFFPSVSGDGLRGGSGM
jgi:RNase P subunit RPR2